MEDQPWRLLAARQLGLLTREQLLLVGVDRHRVRNQLRAERWREVSPTVLCTTDGALTCEQLLWAGVLHAGPPAAVGGLTCAATYGLRNWQRAEVTVVVPKSDTLPALPGVHFVETRRDIAAMTSPRPGPPHLFLEPALLLFAAYTRSERTAAGVLAAAVQQRLTTPAALDAGPQDAPVEAVEDVARLLGRSRRRSTVRGRARRRSGMPSRRSGATDPSGPPPGPTGTAALHDCEWALPDGRTVVLEVDGGLHMEAESWWRDMARERELVIAGKVVLRCSTTGAQARPVPHRARPARARRTPWSSARARRLAHPQPDDRRG